MHTARPAGEVRGKQMELSQCSPLRDGCLQQATHQVLRPPHASRTLDWDDMAVSA